jgi:hypothetical protein
MYVRRMAGDCRDRRESKLPNKEALLLGDSLCAAAAAAPSLAAPPGCRLLAG